MNYCVYNKELDQFLHLTYSFEEMGGSSSTASCEASWRDEFVYALANHNVQVPFETVWPEDTELDGTYFLFVCRRIDEMDTSKSGMKHIGFVPITDNIPDFEREQYFFEN